MKMLIKHISFILMLTLICNICSSAFNFVYASDNYVSILEQDEDAILLLGADSLFMINNDYYFTKEKKKNYTDFGAASYITEDGVIMVPAQLVAEGFSLTIAQKGNSITTSNGGSATLGTKLFSGGELDSAPVVKNGVLFVPAASFTEKVLGKYSYLDERGFVLISENKITYTNTSSQLDKIDVIYRYMQFDNPSGDKIYADMFRNGVPKRPSFLVKPEELSEIRNKIETNSEFKAGAISIINAANSLVSNTSYVEWEIYDGLRLLNKCHAVNDVVHTLTVAYLLTDNTKYLDRLWAEIKNVLVVWPDLNMPGALSQENPSSGGHMLDAGTISEGLAIAYDVLYDYLPESDKQLMKEKYQEKVLDYFVGVCNGTSAFTAKDSRLRTSNWGAVVGGGIFMLSMSMMASETDENSVLAQKCKFVAENALKILRFPVHNFFPDGACDESIGYYGFYLAGLGFSHNAMINFCGTDYGFSNAPGWESAAEFMVCVQSLNGTYNFGGSSRSDHSHSFHNETFLLAKLFNNMDQMELLNFYRKKLGKAYTGIGLLFAKPTDTESFDASLPLDKHYRGALQFMRGDWLDKNSAFVGIREAIAADSGSFIFESDSVRWFSDLGADNPYVAGGYYSANGYTLYAKRTEGHNALIINAVNDGYPEQKIDTRAKQISQQSKPRGAIAIYDMIDGYGYSNTGKHNASSYKRGFFLTDDRHSLIVQDELELVQPNSTFHSFFHVTENGVITINPDGKSGTVEKAGEILDFTVICDADEWKLERWDAVYIDPSMDRNLLTDDPDKMEYDRSDISKIAIVGKDSGKLNISVKMSVRNKDRKYSEHTFVPMSAWQIPDGERPYETKFLNIKDNQLITRDDISLNAQIGESFDSAELLVDGEVCDKISSGTAGEYKFNINGDYLKGKHSSKISIRLAKGEAVKIKAETMVELCDVSQKGSLCKTVRFDGYTDGTVAPTDIYINEGLSNLEASNGQKFEIVSQYGDLAYKITLPATNSYNDYNHIERSHNKVIIDGIAEIGFSISVSDIHSVVQFSPRGAGSITFDDTGSGALHIFKSGGKIADSGEFYFTGQEYKVKILLDFSNGEYELYVDEKIASRGSFSCSDDAVFEKYRLTYRTSAGFPCDFIIDDVYANYTDVSNYVRDFAFYDKNSNPVYEKDFYDGKIPSDIKKISAMFSVSSDGLKVFSKDGKELSADISEENNLYTFTIADGLEEYTSYEIRDNGISILEFETAGDNDSYFGDVVVGADGLYVNTLLKAKENNVCGIFEAFNSGETARTVYVIVCNYEDGAMVDFEIVPVEIGNGNRRYEAIVLPKATAEYSKIMVWDTLTGIVPLLSTENITISTMTTY